MLNRWYTRQAVFPHIFHNLFAIYKRKNFYRDAEFASKLAGAAHTSSRLVLTVVLFAALQAITPADLGVSLEFCLIDPIDESMSRCATMSTTTIADVA